MGSNNTIVLVLLLFICKQYQESKSCVLTKHHAMKAYWGSGGIPPLFDLGTRWS